MPNDTSKKSLFELRTYVIYFRDLSIRSSERLQKALENWKLSYLLNNDVEQIRWLHTRALRSLIYNLFWNKWRSTLINPEF